MGNGKLKIENGMQNAKYCKVGVSSPTMSESNVTAKFSYADGDCCHNWLLIKFVFCVIFFTFLTNAAAAEDGLARSIVQHRDFFLRLNGYSDCLLNDIMDIERGKLLGIILLSPEGLEQRLVFEAATMRQVYASARILDKRLRVYLMDTSIRMNEVQKLAYAAKLRAAELSRVWPLKTGKPGNIIHKSVNAKATQPKQAADSAATAQRNENSKSRGHISNIRKTVEEDVASLSTKEILERFRAEMKRPVIDRVV